MVVEGHRWGRSVPFFPTFSPPLYEFRMGLGRIGELINTGVFAARQEDGVGMAHVGMKAC